MSLTPRVVQGSRVNCTLFCEHGGLSVNTWQDYFQHRIYFKHSQGIPQTTLNQIRAKLPKILKKGHATIAFSLTEHELQSQVCVDFTINSLLLIFKFA